MPINTLKEFCEWMASIPSEDVQEWGASIDSPLLESGLLLKAMAHKKLERQRTLWKATGEMVEVATVTFTCEIRLRKNGDPDHED